jgi:hypothetical protein
VRWGDVEDVKAWSESFREAGVESSPVIGYGIKRWLAWVTRGEAEGD